MEAAQVAEKHRASRRGTERRRHPALSLVGTERNCHHDHLAATAPVGPYTNSAHATARTDARGPYTNSAHATARTDARCESPW